MADVLIRGIEMPCNAEGCEVIIRIQPNGEVLDAHKIHIGATAISLPEGHGRLIDADALIIDSGINTFAACFAVANAPTIVPAEQSEENACCSGGGRTMKVRTVIPCICAGKPDFTADGTAGMPVLRPYAGRDSYWHIWCPKCQRGRPSFDYKSPYMALKAWNEMQEHLRKFDVWFDQEEGGGEDG